MNIALLSDTGTQGGAVLRAALLDFTDFRNIADISHKVAPLDIVEGAYLLRASYKSFAQGSVFIYAVDIFHGDTHDLVLAQHNGYYFLGPDNGLLPLSFGVQPQQAWRCHTYNTPCSLPEWAKALITVLQRINSNALSYSAQSLQPAPVLTGPRQLHDSIDCPIKHVDRYGNIVLDITGEQFATMTGDSPFKIQVMREKEELIPARGKDDRDVIIKKIGPQDVTTLSLNYNDVAEGQPLVRLNNTGYLEIAINHASAAAFMTMDDPDADALLYKTVKIFF